MKNKILLGTGSLYNYGLNRTFELAKSAGYDGVELMLDNTWDNLQSEYLNELQKEFNLPILSVHAGMDFVYLLGNTSKERLFNSLEIAKSVKARSLVVHPSEPYNKRYEIWFANNLKSIEGKAEPMQVLAENLPRKYYREDLRRLAFGCFKPKDFGKFPKLCFDTSHFGTTKGNLLAVTKKCIRQIKQVHLSDFDFKIDPEDRKSFYDSHLMPGKGKLPLDKFLQTLKQNKFTGDIVLELCPDTLGAGDDQKVLKNLISARRFVEKYLF